MNNPLNVEVGEIIEFSDTEDFKKAEVDRFAQYSTNDDERWYSENAGWRFARRISEVNYKNPATRPELRPELSIKTLRDEFAMAALSGILAHPDCRTEGAIIAKASYVYADEMLKARKQGDGK